MTTAVRPTSDHKGHCSDCAKKAWIPDPLLPVVARAGGVRLLDLGRTDQCWLVANLTAAGMSGEEIADRVHCKIRKIRYLRAEPLTQMLTGWLIAEARAAADAERAAAADRWCRSNLAAHERTTTRLRAQLDQAIAQIRDLHDRCRAQQARAERYLRYLNTPRPQARPRHIPCVGQLALW